jgi:RimJ/RimL family protein N-acetyltransferase
MFDIHIDIDDINISSIQKEDIVSVQQWINLQHLNFKDKEKPLELKEFYERFLEYYVSEGEFFLKISQGNKLIGVLKGRIEFKNPTEVWFWYFLMDNDLRGRGIGSRIAGSVQDYFNQGFGIYDFYTGVCEKDIKVLRFWRKNGYKLIRVSKGFFSVNDQDEDMLILKKALI